MNDNEPILSGTKPELYSGREWLNRLNERAKNAKLYKNEDFAQRDIFDYLKTKRVSLCDMPKHVLLEVKHQYDKIFFLMEDGYYTKIQRDDSEGLDMYTMSIDEADEMNLVPDNLMKAYKKARQELSDFKSEEEACRLLTSAAKKLGAERVKELLS